MVRIAEISGERGPSAFHPAHGFGRVLKALLVGLGVSLGLGMSAAMAAGPAVPLDSFPKQKLTDRAALQNGAKLYMNYCLGCHGISQVRYSRLADLGLSQDQIKSNLILTEAKLGDLIKTTMPLKESANWFGKAPPIYLLRLGRVHRAPAQAPTGFTPTCVVITLIQADPRAGTTQFTQPLACLTCFGTFRAHERRSIKR